MKTRRHKSHAVSCQVACWGYVGGREHGLATQATRTCASSATRRRAPDAWRLPRRGWLWPRSQDDCHYSSTSSLPRAHPNPRATHTHPPETHIYSLPRRLLLMSPVIPSLLSQDLSRNMANPPHGVYTLPFSLVPTNLLTRRRPQGPHCPRCSPQTGAGRRGRASARHCPV